MSGDQKVFVNVSMSLDGYVAPEGMEMEHIHDPGYKDWLNKWMSLQAWLFPLKFIRENLDLGEGGETGTDNDLAEATFKRTGVSIMGKRMFDAGASLARRGTFPHPSLRGHPREARALGTTRWHHLLFRQRRDRQCSGASAGGRRRAGYPCGRRR